MNRELYDTYVQILKDELLPAMGCTEPVAVAYAGALAREALGKLPERVEIVVSRNIVKNSDIDCEQASTNSTTFPPKSLSESYVRAVDSTLRITVPGVSACGSSTAIYSRASEKRYFGSSR